MDPEAGKAIVQVLASVLEKLVRGNDKNIKLGTGGRGGTGGKAAQVVTKFHALRPPSISVKHYLERIAKYASCSSECFVLALVYIDRLIQQAGFTVSSLNIHRVCITSIMLAAKFFDDHYYNNAYYAKIGGVPCSEMNSLELEFLFLINFTLYVEPESYNKYYMELFNHAATLVSPGTSWRLGIRQDAPRAVTTTTKTTSPGFATVAEATAGGVPGGGAKRVRETDGFYGAGRTTSEFGAKMDDRTSSMSSNTWGRRDDRMSGVVGMDEDEAGEHAFATTGEGAVPYEDEDDVYEEDEDHVEDYYDEEEEEEEYLCTEEAAAENEDDCIVGECEGIDPSSDLFGVERVEGGRGGATALGGGGGGGDDEEDSEEESGMDVVRVTKASSSALRSHLMMVHS